MRKKLKTIKKVKSNRGIELAYRKKMNGLFEKMRQDIKKEVTVFYRSFADAPEIAQDVKKIVFKRLDGQCDIRLFQHLRVKWFKQYDDASEEMAKWFAESTGRRTRGDIRKKLKESGFTVELKLSAETQEIMKKAIAENAALIKSIPRQYLDQVEKAAAESFAAGRDLASLKNKLKEIIEKEAAKEKAELSETIMDLTLLEKKIKAIDKKTEARAALIARDQMDKNTQKFALAEAKSVGATQGKWLHVPGLYSSRKTHKEMDGKIFDLNEGLYDKDVKGNVLPGELIFCACQFEVVIPGFVDPKDKKG